tara:strand:- start:1089 stop:1460 length:372 start_codon:yes stop_codon:yes gene_type:complete
MAGTPTAQPAPLFEIDVRLRVVNSDMLYVVVQVDNRSGRKVTELAGYITESKPKERIVSEQRIVHVHPYDPVLTDGQTTIRGYTYPFEVSMDHRFRYHISRVTFRNDNRVFAWSPSDGLIRVE